VENMSVDNPGPRHERPESAPVQDHLQPPIVNEIDAGQRSPEAAERPSDHRWKPEHRESELAERTVTRVEEIDPNSHINEAYRVDFADGTHGVYKPQAGEYTSARASVPDGTCWEREIATFRFDEMMGLNKVPTTASWTDSGEHGQGSLQEWEERSTRALSVAQYSQADQQQMAVLDYVVANSDRHAENYLTGSDGSPVAIDHGYCFPETPADPIRSDFVAAQLGEPLRREVLDQVRAVVPDSIREMLASSGLGPSAVEGAVDRLTEVQRNGAITGEAWSGRICDGNGRDVR
jgi:hypothetical protein